MAENEEVRKSGPPPEAPLPDRQPLWGNVKNAIREEKSITPATEEQETRGTQETASAGPTSDVNVQIHPELIHLCKWIIGKIPPGDEAATKAVEGVKFFMTNIVDAMSHPGEEYIKKFAQEVTNEMDDPKRQIWFNELCKCPDVYTTLPQKDVLKLMNQLQVHYMTTFTNRSPVSPEDFFVIRNEEEYRRGKLDKFYESLKNPPTSCIADVASYFVDVDANGKHSCVDPKCHTLFDNLGDAVCHIIEQHWKKK